MSTAIAEAPTLTITPTIETPSAPAPAKLPGQTLSAVADIVQQPVESVRAWVQEQNYQIIPFNNEEIIAGDIAATTLDYFGSIWLQQQKAKLGLNAGTPASLNSKAAAPARPAKTSAKADRIRSLTLPRNYATRVAKQSRISLERALPQNPQLKAEYLDEMAEQTERGMEFLDKIAAAMVKKFGGDKSKLMGSLLQAAKKMQSEVPA